MAEKRLTELGVRVSITDWGLGDWPERLVGAIKVDSESTIDDTGNLCIHIKIHGTEGVELALHSIIREAIETFFNVEGPILMMNMDADTGDISVSMYSSDINKGKDLLLDSMTLPEMITGTTSSAENASISDLLEGSRSDDRERLIKIRAHFARMIDQIDNALAT